MVLIVVLEELIVFLQCAKTSFQIVDHNSRRISFETLELRNTLEA